MSNWEIFEGQGEIGEVTEEILTHLFCDEKNNSAKKISEGVSYFQVDESGVLKEISQDTTIVETQVITLPIMPLCENVAVDKSNVPTVKPKYQTYSNENEDELTALDNLLTVLEEPPKKKSVWDHFDLVMKNQPLAEHIAESEKIKSIMNKPVRINSNNRTNSKRKAKNGAMGYG